jgi:hypothetical protein
MGLVICFSCGRQRNMQPVKRKLICSNCGARGPRVLHRFKVWMDVAEKEGVSKDEARRRVYAGLLWIRDAKGYRAAYADMKFRTIYGEKPNGERGVEPEAPDGELLKWVDRQNAAWKGERKKAEAIDWSTFL